MAKSLLLSVLVLGVILGSGYVPYRLGYDRGFQDVQAQWKKQEEALTVRARELEVIHSLAQEKVAHEAQKAREEHEATLAAQRAAYEQRLSQSTRRAEVYRSQAEAGTNSARGLADHAARLDRALEEGLGLVKELRGALGLREAQLRLLGEQLQNDRHLASEEL